MRSTVTNHLSGGHDLEHFGLVIISGSRVAMWVWDPTYSARFTGGHGEMVKGKELRMRS